MIVAAGASLKDALRSIRRHLLFRSLDKRVVALNKGRSFRTDDRKKSADLLQTIDKAIAKNPGDAALLLLMKAEVYQTAGFYTEAFDLLYACFEKDRSEANVVARRVSRLLTVIGFNRTGWESVQFTQPERSVTRTEFLNAILPKLEALKAALPRSPVMTETLRKRLMLLGNAANLVAFDEANFARRPTTDASASLIQSLIRDFDSSRKVDSLVRALMSSIESRSAPSRPTISVRRLWLRQWQARRPGKRRFSRRAAASHQSRSSISIGPLRP